MFKEVKINGLAGGDWSTSGTSRSVSKSPGRTLILSEHMDGEQLEEMIAAAPLDLSVLPIPAKPLRNAESPLDLSLKTRKRTADSTDENPLKYFVSHGHGPKKICQGVGVSVDNDRKLTHSYISELETNNNIKCSTFKSEVNMGCDRKPSVIKPSCSIDVDMTRKVHQINNQLIDQHYYQQHKQQQSQTFQQNQTQNHQQHIQQLKLREQQQSHQEHLSLHQQQQQQQHISPSQQQLLRQQMSQQQQQLSYQQQISQNQVHQQQLQKLQRQPNKQHVLPKQPEYRQQEQQHKSHSHVTQQEQIHKQRMHNSLFQQQLKQRQQQQQQQRHQQLQGVNKQEVIHQYEQEKQQNKQPYVQSKVVEKGSSVYSGYTVQHYGKTVNNSSYANCDTGTSRIANSVTYSEAGKTGYIKQLEQYGSHNHSYTFKSNTTDSPRFEQEGNSVQKHVSHYPSSVGQTQIGRSRRSGYGAVPSINLQYYNGGSAVIKRHSPPFETIQRCSPDSTISTNSPKQLSYNSEPTDSYNDRVKLNRPVVRMDHQQRADHVSCQTYPHLQVTPPSGFTEPQSPAGSSNGSFYSSVSPRENSPGLISRCSPSSFRGLSPSSLHQQKGGSRGSSPCSGRNVSPYLSHSLSPLVHSAMSSPVVPVTRAMERSIIKGTSGICKLASSDNSIQGGIHSSSNFCDNKTRLQPSLFKHSPQRHIPERGHTTVAAHIADSKSSVLEQTVPDICIKSDSQFSIPNHGPLHRTSSFSCEKSVGKDIKKEDTKCKAVGTGTPEEENCKTEEERERYSHPLTIAIPGNTASATSAVSTQPNQTADKKIAETTVKTPRPYSKKQIIMNAVNNDECLKKIVNIVTPPRPKVPISSSYNAPEHQVRRNVSPSFPESPKMPTLSPQQKLSPAMVSPLIGDPPTLDPPDVSSQRQRMEQGSKMSLLRKYPYVGTAERADHRNDDNSTSVIDNDSRLCRDHSNFVSKWNSYSKNIPVANVSPMVHGHSTAPAKQKSEKTSNETCSVHIKSENDSVRSVERKESGVSETFINLKFDERYADDDLVLQDKDQVTSIVTDSRNRSSPVIKTLRQLNRVDEVKSEVASDFSQDEDYKSDSSERKTSKSRSSSADKPRSLLAEIANSDGYVADSIPKGKTEDLLTDNPTMLGREERALLRAIKQFEEMEEKTEQPTSPKSTKTSSIKMKADEIRRKARRSKQRVSRTDRLLGSQKWIGRRKRKKKSKPKGFIDFKPKVLEPRTRTQAAGKKPTYDRNAAYDRELSREECRKAQKRRERLRQTARRICRRMSEKQEQLAFERRLSMEETSEKKESEESEKNKDCDENKGSDGNTAGMWEVGDTSSALKQTLRNGKSKGGIMMTLLFKPKHLRFGRRHSPRRRGSYQLRASTLGDGTGSRSKRLELGNKLEGARRRGQAARRKLNDQRRQHESDQQLPDPSTTQDAQFDFSDTQFDQTEFINDISGQCPAEVKKLAVCRDTGETILHRAARMGHSEVALQCVQFGRVDVNVKDNAGYTPLHETCVSGHWGIAHLLLSRGASVNCSSQDGIRPIHDAVENDNIELVRLLLAFGADPTLSTYSGKTPLKIARSEKMKRLLEGHLGDLNGFTNEQEPSVWAWPSFKAEEHTFQQMGIFSSIPPDPADENEDDFITESSEPEFTSFKLSKSDTKNTCSSYVLLNDVTDFLQIPLDQIILDNSLKSMITSVTKTRLAASSYGQSHPGRVSSLHETSAKVILSRDLSHVLEICCKHKAATNSALSKSQLPNKFKHYKLQKDCKVFDSKPCDLSGDSALCPGKSGSAIINVSESKAKGSLTLSNGPSTAPSNSNVTLDSVYDFDDMIDFDDIAANFNMKVGAVPEEFNVVTAHSTFKVTNNCHQD